MTTPPISPELWVRFRSTRCPKARDSIVELNLPLVRSVAHRILRRLGDEGDFEDLVGAGCLGLLNAVDAFDPDRGLAFSSFAVPRIEGAILDELRKQDSSTRLSRTRKRAMAKAARAVAARECEAAGTVATANELGIDVATLHEWRSHVQRGSEVSLDRPFRNDHQAATTLADILPSGAHARMERGVVFDESKRRLSEQLVRLPERQRLVLHLYYYEGLQQNRIAEILGVTESRVSQIRTRTLALLRSLLDDPQPTSSDGTGADGPVGLSKAHRPVEAA